MKRRGVSPVIATVLLSVIVVVLAAIIFIWARGFLSESAVKGDRAVSVSCADVEFEAEVVPHASECSAASCEPGEPNPCDAAVDINNIGNVPIYGVQVFAYDQETGSIQPLINVDQPFAVGTITIGRSASVCLGQNIQSQDAFRIVPKLLAEKDGQRVAYTCPEKDGITIAYVGF